MRLIDADALMRVLGINDMDCNKCAWGENQYCIRGREFYYACCAIEEAPTIEPQKWIPCSERLPGAAHVLATLRWDEDDYEVTEMDYHAIVAAQGDKDKVISAGAKNIIKHVIAWMPLPEPWREEE